MNFKTKAIGLLAGSALALSLATGVLADGTTTAELAPNTGGTGCTASAVTGSQNLGVYTWDASMDKWVVSTAADAGNLEVQVNQDIAGTADCSVAISVTDLEHTTISTAKITELSISASGTSVTGTTSPFIVSTNGTITPGATMSLSVTINSIPVTNPAGTYEGTVTLGTVEAAS